ncbi:MAG: phosphate ABC transporter permease subunit PstC, partial [Desulfohalobiaceae bacterium]
LRSNLTWNPLEGMTTVTVRIVAALTGDTAFDSAETLSAFGLGLVLFVITLTLNVISTVVIRKFKQQYEL